MKKISILLLIICIGIFLLLAYKKPWGDFSLTANLEPYPDSLFYSIPAWNMAIGKGFNLNVAGYEVRIITPPLYSFYLIPFFALFKDILIFYYANVLLALITIILFYSWLKRKFVNHKNKYWLVFLGTFVLVTNYYFYYLPSLLMAENISLVLFMALIFSLEIKERDKRIALISTFGILLLMVKMSNLPITLTVLIILVIDWSHDRKIKYLVIPFIVNLVVLGYLMISNFFGKGMVNAAGQSFGLKYIIPNLGFYIESIFGGTTRYLWNNQPLYSPMIGVLMFIGVAVSLGVKELREWRYVLISMGLIGFMSTFYYPDLRYVLILLPLFIYWFLVPVSRIKLNNKLVVIIVFTLFMLWSKKYIIIKQQIGLNFRHKETAWNYLAVLNLNKMVPKNTDTYVASFLPVQYIYPFWKGQLLYLPISPNQQFFNNYSVLDKYKELLSKGKEIYLTDYYMTNRVVEWGEDMKNIKDKFVLTKVADGCHGVCNIYKLNQK